MSAGEQMADAIVEAIAALCEASGRLHELGRVDTAHRCDPRGGEGSIGVRLHPRRGKGGRMSDDPIELVSLLNTNEDTVAAQLALNLAGELIAAEELDARLRLFQLQIAQSGLEHIELKVSRATWA